MSAGHEVAVDGADRPGRKALAAGHREQRGGLHLHREQAGGLPVLDDGVGLGVVGVVGGDRADVDVTALVLDRLGGVDERGEHAVLGDGGVLDGLVAFRRALVLRGAGGNYHVADLDVGLKCADSADADHGVDADGGQLFESDRRRGTADASRTHRHGCAVVGGVDDLVLAVAGDLDDVVTVAGDAVDATGVARHERDVVEFTWFDEEVWLLRHGQRSTGER